MTTRRRIDVATARRIALAAQGFTDPRPQGRVDVRHFRRVLDRIGLLQLDSVIVVERSHYLPMFSRLGPYHRPALDRWTAQSGELFEYWGHAASLLPGSTYGWYRHRMEAFAAKRWKSIDELEAEHPGYIESVYREVVESGPVEVSDLEDPGRRTGPWWGYGNGKRALEWLFFTGRITAVRTPRFTRRYDLPERLLPAHVLAQPALPQRDAHREMLRAAARHLGIATDTDLVDYYRIKVTEARPILREMVAAGELIEVDVPGWDRPTYLHSEARIPRRVQARALLSPFDPVVWERERALRLFGFHYRIEIYVPEPKRVYGYYVMPFLLGDDLVARVDLKSDRQARVLRVRGAYGEADIDRPHVAAELAHALHELASWQGLGSVAVEDRGDLVEELRPRV